MMSRLKAAALNNPLMKTIISGSWSLYSVTQTVVHDDGGRR